MKNALLSLLALIFAAATASAQEPAARVQTHFQNLMNAVQTADYAAMTIDGDPAFKAGLTKEMVEKVSAQLSPRMLQGYTATFLTAMRQAGYEVLIWKLSFKDGKDDMLAKVALNKDGQVAGFWIN